MAAAARDPRGRRAGGRGGGHRGLVGDELLRVRDRRLRGVRAAGGRRLPRGVRRRGGLLLPVAGRGGPHLAVAPPPGPVAGDRALPRAGRRPQRSVAPVVPGGPGPGPAVPRAPAGAAVLGAHRLQLRPAHRRDGASGPGVAVGAARPAPAVRRHRAQHGPLDRRQRHQPAGIRGPGGRDPGRLLPHHRPGLLGPGAPLAARAGDGGAHPRLRDDQRRGHDARLLRPRPGPQPGGRAAGPPSRPRPARAAGRAAGPRPPARRAARRSGAGRLRCGGRRGDGGGPSVRDGGRGDGGGDGDVPPAGRPQDPSSRPAGRRRTTR